MLAQVISSMHRRVALLFFVLLLGEARHAGAQDIANVPPVDATPSTAPPLAPPSYGPTSVLPSPAIGTMTAANVRAPLAPVPDGQWVFTAQYGWVWIPYASNYAYYPTADTASVYVYGPNFGWSWVSAPWIFGAGIRPYWGMRGDSRYVWYARPPLVRPFRPYPYYHYQHYHRPMMPPPGYLPPPAYGHRHWHHGYGYGHGGHHRW